MVCNIKNPCNPQPSTGARGAQEGWTAGIMVGVGQTAYAKPEATLETIAMAIAPDMGASPRARTGAAPGRVAIAPGLQKMS